MTLAEDIAAFLQDEYVKQHRPFGFTVDSHGKLADWWGDAGAFGFTDLQRGCDMLKRAPWLHGNLGQDAVHLPILTTPTTGPVEVHVRPRATDYLVLLLSREDDHDATQVRQQSVNENRLLHAHQQKLIRRQRELIAELVETRAELDHRRREAERANADKSRFIAMMSHEFRTPLTSIISYTERMEDAGYAARDVEECSAAIARASRHMHNMVNTVLDEARLEAGRQTASSRPFELRALVDDLAAIVAPLAGEKALSFAASIAEDAPSCVRADDGCLRQVVLNLLGNAIKYTDQGHVRLHVGWRDGQLTMTVSDSGPGIALADQERMFRAFERGDRHVDSTTGTGLGLAISLQLARLMDGSLDLESDPGNGCRVTVTVPAPAVERRADSKELLAPPPQDLQTRRPARVLICDDDPDMRAIHEYYLTRAGYELLATSDSRSAVEIALREVPDAVVLDINTPGMSGSEAAAEMRERGVAAPLIALTASDASKLDPALFAKRLRKPLPMPELLAALQSVLELQD